MAWELGGGMGHTARLVALARGLQSDARITLALRDLTQATLLPDGVPWTVHQAPLWLPEARGLPDAASYAEVLFRFGFLDARRLLPVVRAWRSLYELTGPDLLLVDHAPTALLAARGLPMRRALIGTGFFSPPPQRPMPAFRIWEKLPPGRLEQAEAMALDCANEVLDALQAPRLAQLSDLLTVDENFLTTWPELDHYPQRPEGTRYWGPEALLDNGEDALWPEGDGPCVFAYLKWGEPQTAQCLEVFARARTRTLAVVPGMPVAMRDKLQNARLRIGVAPVRLDQACARCDVVVCNANSGTVSAMLQAGKPVILLPAHAEQYLFALRVQHTGAGVLLEPAGIARMLPKRLLELAADGPHRRAAQDIARRYAGVDLAGTLDRVVFRLRELLERAASPPDAPRS